MLSRQAVIDDFNEEIDSIPQNQHPVKVYSFSPEFEIRATLGKILVEWYEKVISLALKGKNEKWK